MEQRNTRLRNAGFVTFFFSGICTISSGVVVSLLQEEYGFAYGMTGTLLSLLSIGNLLAGLLAGALVGKMGMKPSVLLLTIGYAVGYGLMGLTGLPILLALAFFIVGIAKGSVLNTCTILVSGNSADRTRGMNTMHACYACGALLCPFLISAAARVSTTLAVLALAALGLVLWLVYLFTPMAGRAKAKEAVTDWNFFALLPLLAAHRPAVLPERRRAERCGLDGHLLQGQRHHCRHAGGLYRHRDVGCHPDRPPAHRLCVPTQTAPQGHGVYGGFLHCLLLCHDADPQPAACHPAAVRLCLLHGRYEPHRRGQRR